MAIVINDSLKNNSPKSLDNKYLKNGITSYLSVDEANASISYKSLGLTVFIDGVEYWYIDGVNLVRKSVSLTNDLVDEEMLPSFTLSSTDFAGDGKTVPVVINSEAPVLTNINTAIQELNDNKANLINNKVDVNELPVFVLSPLDFEGDGTNTPIKLNPNGELLVGLRDDVVVLTDEKSNRVPVIKDIPNSYVLVLSDKTDVLLRVTASNPITITLPQDSTVNFPIGTIVSIYAKGTGLVTIAGQNGVTINSADGATKLRSRYSTATVIKEGINEWLLSGDITI